MSTLPLALLVALATPPQVMPPPPATDSAVVTGVVRGGGNPEPYPLAWAMIELRGAGAVRTVLADSLGRYRIPGVPAGTRRVRAIHVGYAPVTVDVLVPPSGTLELDLELTPRPVELPALVVETHHLRVPDPDDRDDAVDGQSRALVGLRALEASPGLAESGLGEAGRGAPGNEPNDPADVLLMRGSTQDLKLVLLDGAPVYTPFHIGGLIEGFDARSLARATHHVGGAPARFDGGLSYILDLRTRAPSRRGVRGAGAVDLMSVAGSVEGPVGDAAGLGVSTRALHGLGSRLAGGDGSPYGYVDALVRAEADVGGGTLRFTAFGNRESVYLDLPGGSGSPDSIGSTPGTPPGSAPGSAQWGNQVVSGGWSGDLGAFEMDVGASASQYDAELPIRRSFRPAGSQDWRDAVLLASGRTDRQRATLDLLRPGRTSVFRTGLSFDRVSVRYGSVSLTEGGPAPEANDATGTVFGAYLDGTRGLAPELDLRWGGRLDLFDPGGARGAVRLALLWTVSPSALLTLAGGRYHQLARLSDAEADLAVGDGVQVGAGYWSGMPESTGGDPLLAVASSDHLVVSLDQTLTSSVRLGLEGFIKAFHGLDGRDDALSASGVDLRLVREGERSTGWLGYSLSWFWETDADGAGSEFSGRHLLSAGFRGPVAGPTGLDLRVSFSDGLPLTAIPFASERLNEPVIADDPSLDQEQGPPSATGGLDDGFLRLDAELFADLETEWGGRTIHLRPYLRVLNALDRRDALFYYFEPWRDDDIRPLAELSLVPVLGMEWRF